MSYQNPDRLTELLDREAIRDCLYTYARGVDRGDMAALQAAYWPDARDCHGALANGPVALFFKQCEAIFAKGPRNIHVITNVLIDFKSATRARVESYFTAYQRLGASQVQMVGRYNDQFEKREGQWRVLDRQVIYDWIEPQTAPLEDEATRFGGRTPIGQAYPRDPIYQPLSDS